MSSELSGEKSAKCPKCEKQLGKKDIRVERLNRSGEKFFVCELCGFIIGFGIRF